MTFCDYVAVRVACGPDLQLVGWGASEFGDVEVFAEYLEKSAPLEDLLRHVMHAQCTTFKSVTSASELAAAAVDLDHYRIMRRMGTHTALATPMLWGVRSVGVASFTRTVRAAPFTEEDVPEAKRLAALFANAKRHVTAFGQVMIFPKPRRG